MNRKKLYLLAAIAALAAVAVPFWLLRTQKGTDQLSPREQVVVILQDGVDTSNSLFQGEDNEEVKRNIEAALDEVKAAGAVSGDQVLKVARGVRDLRDFDKAIPLYELTLKLGTDDFLAGVELGNIYFQQGNYEKSVEQYELVKLKYPSLYEAHLGLANAYKNIEGTPQYVVDDIYRLAIARMPGIYELYDEYVDWLEKTDREEQTLEYLEVMNKINPQPLLEQKIADIKQRLQS